jgi:hypothetical protein
MFMLFEPNTVYAQDLPPGCSRGYSDAKGTRVTLCWSQWFSAASNGFPGLQFRIKGPFYMPPATGDVTGAGLNYGSGFDGMEGWQYNVEIKGYTNEPFLVIVTGLKGEELHPNPTNFRHDKERTTVHLTGSELYCDEKERKKIVENWNRNKKDEFTVMLEYDAKSINVGFYPKKCGKEKKRTGDGKIDELAEGVNSNKRSAEEERIAKEKKENDDRQTAISKAYNEGVQFYNEQKYDEAIAKYNEAQNVLNYYDNREGWKDYYEANHKLIMDGIALAREGKRNAARKERTNTFNQEKQQQNEAAAAGIGAAAGLMALAKDFHSNKAAAIRFKVGIGYESIPTIANTQQIALGPTYNKSRTITNGVTQVVMGLKMTFANKSAVNFEVTPQLGYGLNLFRSKTKGADLFVGGNATLYLAPKKTSKLKLFAEAGYHYRTGNVDIDSDASGTTASDLVENATYDYKFIRFGGGIMFKQLFKHYDDQQHDLIIKPAVYFDKFTFTKNSKPAMVGGLTIGYTQVGFIEVLYSKNYTIGGILTYKNNFDDANQNYLMVRFVRHGLFGQGKKD